MSQEDNNKVITKTCGEAVTTVIAYVYKYLDFYF